jgi:hypothetical protein
MVKKKKKMMTMSKMMFNITKWINLTHQQNLLLHLLLKKKTFSLEEYLFVMED